MTNYIDPATRYKQERELRKAKKKVRKQLEPTVGPKAARRLVKEATMKVMEKKETRDAIPYENK